LKLFVDVFHPAVLWHWGQISLKQNEYEEYFLGCKEDSCVELANLPPSSAICLEILGSQIPGTLRACPGEYRDCLNEQAGRP